VLLVGKKLEARGKDTKYFATAPRIQIDKLLHDDDVPDGFKGGISKFYPETGQRAHN
jgi:hypothetical protein